MGISEILTVIGITPACAGKTLPAARADCCKRDHPCVCGENCTTQRAIDSVKGSPLRVRGKPKKKLQHLTYLGITPACAGKTLTYYSD